MAKDKAWPWLFHMAPVSQELEPPQNPGRFKAFHGTSPQPQLQLQLQPKLYINLKTFVLS